MLYKIITIGITALIIFMTGFYYGYRYRDNEIEELNKKNKNIIEEFENYKRNRNIQTEKIKEELRILREKQSIINGIVKQLKKARNERNINELKRYIDILIRKLKE